jgi:hypothetical protein
MDLEDVSVIVLPTEQRHYHTTEDEDKAINAIFQVKEPYDSR